MSTDSPNPHSMPEGPLGIDAIAGEYVLGTLSLARRQQMEARLPLDAELREAVWRWELRLLPLTALAQPVEPAPALWSRIAQSVEGQAASAVSAVSARAMEADEAFLATSPRATPAALDVPPSLQTPAMPVAPERVASRPRTSANAANESLWNRLWHNMALWRGLAGTGFAAAAALAVVLLVPASGVPASSGYLVVLVAPANQSAGWVVQARAPGQLELLPVGQASATSLPAGKALQFWTKADGWTKPVSLGLVTPGQAIRVPLDQLPPLQPNQLFELTIEPAGGSPTNVPTGPIQFIGRAVKVAA